MRQKPGTKQSHGEKVLKDIYRFTLQASRSLSGAGAFRIVSGPVLPDPKMTKPFNSRAIRTRFREVLTKKPALLHKSVEG